MSRFFLEVSYKGTHYSGFQIQQNANTIQAEVERALEIIFKKKLELTGSSRTDAGVHAAQNYFHFDIDKLDALENSKSRKKITYNLNAILPPDIVIRNILPVADGTHCRFDAFSREYHYYISGNKNPFLQDRAFYFPFKLNFEKMQKAAAVIKEYEDFTSFCKKNTQAKTFVCRIEISRWIQKDSYILYKVKANRFLRGMVRGLTATMLDVGRNKISLEEFRGIIETKDCTKANFTVPPHGLFLISVHYPSSIII